MLSNKAKKLTKDQTLTIDKEVIGNRVAVREK